MEDWEFSGEIIKQYLCLYRFLHIIFLQDFLTGLPKGLVEKIAYMCGVFSAKELKKIIKLEDNAEWNNVKVVLKNDTQPSLNDADVATSVDIVTNLEQEVVNEWFDSVQAGGRIYMRQCTRYLNYGRRAAKKDRKKETKVERKRGEVKQVLCRSLVTMENETNCKIIKCGAIITGLNPEQIQLIYMKCEDCFIGDCNKNLRFTLK